jgi:hypothetical protein
MKVERTTFHILLIVYFKINMDLLIVYFKIILKLRKVSKLKYNINMNVAVVRENSR